MISLRASVVTRARPGIFDERKVSQSLRKSSPDIRGLRHFRAFLPGMNLALTRYGRSYEKDKNNTNRDRIALTVRLSALRNCKGARGGSTFRPGCVLQGEVCGLPWSEGREE